MTNQETAEIQQLIEEIKGHKEKLDALRKDQESISNEANKLTAAVHVAQAKLATIVEKRKKSAANSSNDDVNTVH